MNARASAPCRLTIAAILFAVVLGDDVLGLDDGGLELLELGFCCAACASISAFSAATSAAAVLTSAS